MRVCATCSHAERDAIESAITTGVSIAEISRRWGMSIDSLYRHRDYCLPNRLANGQSEHDMFSTETLMNRIEWLQRATVDMYKRNLGVNDGIALKALARVEAQLNSAVRVKEFILKKDKATGNCNAQSIADMLVRARARVAAAKAAEQAPKNAGKNDEALTEAEQEARWNFS